MLDYMEKKQYKKAMEIADTIDWRRVKNSTMLSTVSEIYECNGENQKSRDILFIAYDRAPESRKIVYRLGTLAVKLQDLQEAEDCYEEFVKVAPKDPNRYILKYKILKAQNAPIGKQIEALVEFKKVEYVEKWAYELAKLYNDAGMVSECLEECDDLILWFSEGKYVLEAMRLKMQYKPLTPLQQEKYNICVENETKAQFQFEDNGQEEMRELTPTEGEDLGKTQLFVMPGKNEQEEVTKEEVVEQEEITEPVEEENTVSETSEKQEEEVDGEEGEVTEETETFGTGSKIIQTTVAGATLAEALAKGFAAATEQETSEPEEEIWSENTSEEIVEDYVTEEPEESIMPEEAPMTAQEKIEGILQNWEEKQREVEQQIAEKKKQAEAEKAEESIMPEEAPMTAQEKIEGILQNWEEKQREVEQQIAEKKKQAEAEKAAREEKQQRENMFNTAPIIPDDIQKLLDDLENGILDSDLNEEEEVVETESKFYEEKFEDDDFDEEFWIAI